MFKPLHAISAAFLILVMLWPDSALRADQPFQRFLPLLVDLAGWQGKKPEGMSAQMSDASVTTAARDYERARRRFIASVCHRAGRRGRAGADPDRDQDTDHRRSHDHGKHAGHAGPQTFNSKDKTGALVVALARTPCSALPMKGHRRRSTTAR
jgi:hypothetical protein